MNYDVSSLGDRDHWTSLFEQGDALFCYNNNLTDSTSATAAQCLRAIEIIPRGLLVVPTTYDVPIGKTLPGPSVFSKTDPNMPYRQRFGPATALLPSLPVRAGAGPRHLSIVACCTFIMAESEGRGEGDCGALRSESENEPGRRISCEELH